MTPNDHEQLERLLEVWDQSRRAGRPPTVAQLAADAPHLMAVLSHRIRLLEWARRHEPGDSVPLSVLETALAVDEPSSVTARPAHAMAAGDTFDGLTLIRRIGSGGMGDVWEANDPGLDRRVAVKVILPTLVGNPTAVRRFAREARAYAAVEHPNVLTVHSVGEFDGRPYLVMPLLEGETLSARLRREPALPPEEVLRIGRAVAAGLDALHARGLIHRDVKPANIWLSADGSVKVLDLGLARPGDGLLDGEPISFDGVVVGTPAYMSPEQADGREVGPRSDLFSLGVVLYQSATGTNPFAAPSIMAALSALATRTPEPPSDLRPGLPAGVDDLVLGMLAKPAEQRTPGTAAEVAKRLEAIEAGGLPRVCSFTNKRRPCWPWAVGLVVALVGVGVGLWAWFAPRPPTPDELVVEFATRLQKQPISDYRKEESIGGMFKNKRVNELRFTGETGEPVPSPVENGTAVIRIPYSGRSHRKIHERLLGQPLPVMVTEVKTVNGVVAVSVRVTADGVRMTGYEVVETGGDATDPNHHSQRSARDAALNLVRDVLPEK